MSIDARQVKLQALTTSNTAIAAGDTLEDVAGKTQGQLNTTLNTVVEGLDLYMYSHSFGNVQSPANCSPNRLYQKLLLNRLNFGSLTTRANNGYEAQDVAAVLTSINAFTLGNTGIVIIDCAQNSLRIGTTSGVMSTQSRNAFKHSLRGMLWYLMCSSIKQETDASLTYTGTWTTLTQTWFMGGTMKTSINQNDQVSIAVNGTDFVLFTRATSSVQGIASVTVDGTLKATIDNTGGNQGVIASSTLASTSAPYAVPLTGLSSGAHTIILKKTDASGAGAGVYVDAIGTISTTPPTILVHKQVYLPDALYTSWANGASNTTVDAINADIDTVIAEFSAYNNIIAVNPNTNGWDRTTMTGINSTGHPNDKGMIKIVETDIKALTGIAYRSGLNVL